MSRKIKKMKEEEVEEAEEEEEAEEDDQMTKKNQIKAKTMKVILKNIKMEKTIKTMDQIKESQKMKMIQNQEMERERTKGKRNINEMKILKMKIMEAMLDLPKGRETTRILTVHKMETQMTFQ